MYRKQLSKANQEWLWTDTDQNDSFSDSSYLFPVQRILQNEVMIARTEANWISILGNQIKDICYWWDVIRKVFFVGLLLYVITQPLIAWLNECGWHQLSTIAQPWTARLRAWTQLTYFLSFSTTSVFPLHFALNRIFHFAQCPKRQGDVNNLRVTLVAAMLSKFF